MTKINDFNSSLYYLGKICKYKHIFSDTKRSLRQISNRTCIECQKIIKRKYVSLNPELCAERNRRWRRNIAVNENIVLAVEKKCSVCGERKSTKDFQSEKYSLNGFRSHCKACDKERQSAYRAPRRKPRILKDPELIKENRRKIKKRYKKTLKGKLAATKALHRRKAIMMNVEAKLYSPSQLLLRFAEFENKCAYCGNAEKLSIDHFVPISKFGADSLENIVPACLRCNSSKNNKNPEVWFKKQTCFSIEKWEKLIGKIKFQF